MATASKRPSPYGAKKFSSIDEYHAHFPQGIKAVLDKLRAAIRQAAPKAEEVISYNMPAFKMNRVLVYYAANKEHIGFYPTPGPIMEFKDELAEYKTSKGAIQFPLDKPMPLTLVKKMVKLRIAEDEKKLKAKTGPAATKSKTVKTAKTKKTG